jgi:hypothetical protein
MRKLSTGLSLGPSHWRVVSLFESVRVLIDLDIPQIYRNFAVQLSIEVPFHGFCGVLDV